MRGKNQAITGVLCLAVLSAFFISHCTFKQPAAPNWDVLFELPLLSERFIMSELADEHDELKIEGNQVILSFEEELETFEIGDRLAVGTIERSNIMVPANGFLTDSLELPNDLVVVDTAALKQGYLEIIFENRGSNPVDVSIVLNDLINPVGQIFDEQVTVPGGTGQTASIHKDLAGFIMVPPIRNGSNFMRFTVTLTGGETVDVTLRITDIVFSSISGIINELEVPIEDVEVELDIPETFQDLEIDTVDLKLAVDAGVGFPVIFDLTVQGIETDDGVLHEIIVNDTIVPVPGEMSIIEVTGVAGFFNAHPKTIYVSGRVLVGDGVTRSRIDEHHVINATVYLEMPLTIKLPNYSTKIDVDVLELDQDTRDALNENLISASFQADVENGLPIGVSASIVFSTNISDSTIYDPGNADLSFNLDLLPAPNDGGSPAVVTGTARSSFGIDLNQTNLDLFRNNEKLYWGVKLDFPGTAEMVKFRPQDYIDISAHISALINTKVPEDEDEEGGAL